MRLRGGGDAPPRRQQEAFLALQNIKILQANLNRSRAAHDIAHMAALREGVDIIVASEPNQGLCKKYGWLTDQNVDVAVYLYNKNIEVDKIKKKNGYLQVKLKEVSLFCCYSSPNIAFTEFNRYMEDLWSDVRLEGGNPLCWEI